MHGGKLVHRLRKQCPPSPHDILHFSNAYVISGVTVQLVRFGVTAAYGNAITVHDIIDVLGFKGPHLKFAM